MSVALADWVDRFLIPLYRLADVHVQAFTGERAHTQQLHALSIDDRARFEGVRRHAAALCGGVALAPIEAGEWSMACVVNNLFFALHPQTSPRTRMQIVTESTQFLPPLPPANGSEMMGRHLVVRALLSLSRPDSRVTFWLGERTYLGQPPPRRMQRFAGLRRVRTEKWQTTMWSEIASRPDLKVIAQKTIAASPLTAWLDAITLGGLTLRPILFCLTDRRVARVIVDRYLSLHAADRGALVSRALLELCEDPAATAAQIRLALCLLVHLQLLEASPSSPMVTPTADLILADERDYRGLYVAAEIFGIDGPADLTLGLTSRPTWEVQYRARCRLIAGAARIDRLTQQLATRLGSPARDITVLS